MEQQQNEITRPTLLLAKTGNIANPGYARQMYYCYNPSRISTSIFSLKEWDFYQIDLGDYILQLTIGHLSYIANFNALLISMKGDKLRAYNAFQALPLRSLNMPLFPGTKQKIEKIGKNYSICFEVKNGYRHLTMHASLAEGPINIDLLLPENPADEKMVIATPFYKSGQFYLNCKQHFYGITGSVTFGDITIQADGTQTGLLDWGRGVWPFHQEWFWGCGNCFVGKNKFGFNIGWGFGNTQYATENMFFWNGKAYKLGTLEVTRDPNNYMAPWHFVDSTGNFDFTMTPSHNHYTETKVAFIDKHCNQVFGMFNGFVKLPNGKKIQIKNMQAFCEHSENNW